MCVWIEVVMEVNGLRTLPHEVALMYAVVSPRYYLQLCRQQVLVVLLSSGWWQEVQ